MPQSNCEECNGTMVRVNLNSVAGGEHLKVSAQKAFTWGTYILAYGCANCGKLEFYAEKPEKPEKLR